MPLAYSDLRLIACAAALVAAGRSRSEGFAAVRSLRGAGEGGTGAAHPVAVAGAARGDRTQDIARSLEAGRPDRDREAAGADFEAAAASLVTDSWSGHHGSSEDESEN